MLGDGWELVGRHRQLRTIEWSAGRADLGGVVLCGPTGVGKTRLAREVLARFGGEWAAATKAASAIPFGALSHLLPGGDRLEERLTVLRKVAARFAVADGPRPLLAVDDAHLLDDASAAALHHVAMRTKAFLLLTVRYGELCPDAVTALWKEGIATRVELPPLTDDAVDALLRQAFGDRMDPASRRRLILVSAGNPLLLRETLRAGLDTGSLRRRRGEWAWSGEVRATNRLTEVVAARITAADARVVRVLELVACGEPLAVALLEPLCDNEAVADAERLGVLVVEQDARRGVARLSHPLYGEVIRSTMARTRAAAVYGELAEALTATPMRRRDDALRAGVWQLRSGRLGDPGVLVAAAREALLRLDNTLAARLARAARDAGGGLLAEQVLAQVLASDGPLSVPTTCTGVRARSPRPSGYSTRRAPRQDAVRRKATAPSSSCSTAAARSRSRPARPCWAAATPNRRRSCGRPPAPPRRRGFSGISCVRRRSTGTGSRWRRHTPRHCRGAGSRCAAATSWG